MQKAHGVQWSSPTQKIASSPFASTPFLFLLQSSEMFSVPSNDQFAPLQTGTFKVSFNFILLLFLQNNIKISTEKFLHTQLALSLLFYNETLTKTEGLCGCIMCIYFFSVSFSFQFKDSIQDSILHLAVICPFTSVGCNCFSWVLC